MGLNYAWEKLNSACDYAVGSAEPLQSRLAAVISSYLINLSREDFHNDEAWAELQEIIDATTCKSTKGDEGTIEATTSQMTSDEAAKWLREVMSLFNDVAEEYGRQSASGQSTGT